MDTISITRQTIAFLCVLAALDLVIVYVFPVIAVIIAGFAVLLGLFVWIKAGFRTQKWFWWNPVAVPLTQAEGAVALSAALLLSIGVVLTGYEGIRFASGEKEFFTGYVWRSVGPLELAKRPIGTRSVNYSNPEMQKEFKDELTKAGIPYTLEEKDGKEWVVWTPEYNEAAEKVEQKVAGVLPPGEHNVSFGDPAQQREFREWLSKRGFPSRIETMRGRDTVVWKGGPDDLPMQFVKEHPGKCPQDKAAGASGKTEVRRC